MCSRRDRHQQNLTRRLHLRSCSLLGRDCPDWLRDGRAQAGVRRSWLRTEPNRLAPGRSPCLVLHQRWTRGARRIVSLTYCLQVTTVSLDQHSYLRILQSPILLILCSVRRVVGMIGVRRKKQDQCAASFGARHLRLVRPPPHSSAHQVC